MPCDQLRCRAHDVRVLDRLDGLSLVERQIASPASPAASSARQQRRVERELRVLLRSLDASLRSSSALPVL